MKNLQQGSRKGRNRRSAGRSASDTIAGKCGCWRCGQPDHFQRDCPKAPTRSVEMAAKPTNTAIVAVASTARVQGNEQQLSLRGVIEPATALPNKPLDGLLVGRTLVNLRAKEVPIHLLNLTVQQKQIKQGTDVAICKSVLVENQCCFGRRSCGKQTDK